MTPLATALQPLRRHPAFGVALFVLLVVLVGGERRLAEAHLNLRSVAAGLESNDTLDGDELRVRLLALNDDKPPTLPAIAPTLTLPRVALTPSRYALRALGRPAPRGPPAARVA